MPPPGSDGGLDAGPSGDPRASCFDAMRRDADGASSCEAPTCAALSECCVASANAGCCAAPITVGSLPSECASGPAEDCVDGSTLRLFGGALPVIEDGALVPQGGLGHGGLALGNPVDPRSVNVTLNATLEVPELDARCTDCVDAAGVGLLAALPAPGERAVIAFGVLATGSRDELIVFVSDVPVARVRLPSGPIELALATNVEGDGVVTMNREVVVAEVSGLVLSEGTWLTALGRTSNRAGAEAVRIRAASATTSTCDVPSALTRRSAPVLPWSSSTWSPREVRRPSVVSYDDTSGERRALMAFAHEGEIYLAGRTGFGEFRNAALDPGQPAFTRPSELVSVRDPWLVIDGQRFVLYFAGVAADGSSSVWRTTGTPSFGQDFGTPAIVVDAGSLGADAIDGPSVIAADGGWTMVVRARRGSETSLMRLTSAGGSSFAPREAAGDPTLHVALTEDLFAFDRDEVSTPALVIAPDANARPIYRLYYTGRRGTRLGIGLLVSEDGVFYRPMGEVLGAGQGFDAFGVADPAPLYEDGVLRIHYAGTDGVRWKIGLAGPAGTLGE